MEPTKALTFSDILGASFGETSSQVRASFRKTVNVRQYETEVIEADAELTFDRQLSGIERAIVSAALQCQMEYDACLNLACKGYLTNEQLKERQTELVQGVNLLKAYGESQLGKSLDYLFTFEGGGMVYEETAQEDSAEHADNENQPIGPNDQLTS